MKGSGKICCVCGYRKKRGIFHGQKTPQGFIQLFTCEDCIDKPFLFNPAKIPTANGSDMMLTEWIK